MKKISVITVFILVATLVIALFSGCATGVKTNKQPAAPAVTATPESGGNEGSGNESSEASGHAEGGEGESGDPSSPILQLDESWDGVVVR